MLWWWRFLRFFVCICRWLLFMGSLGSAAGGVLILSSKLGFRIKERSRG